MTTDVLDWLKAERDRRAMLRDKAFQSDDWAAGNPHDDACRRLFEAIVEIERSRGILEVMKDVLMRRVVEGHRADGKPD
jgi:hypothetical protein